jgi:Ca-activated chloride channel homolog
MSAARVFRFLGVLSLLMVTACRSSTYQHNTAGNRLFDQQGYEESLYEYRQAQVSDPELAEPFYNASNAYNRLGELDAVQTQTLQALENASSGLAAKAWYNLGNAFFDAQNFSAAVEAYKETLRLTPEDIDAKHNLELALLMEEQQDEEQEQQQQSPQAENGENPPNPEESDQSAPTPDGESAEPQESPQSGETPEPSTNPGGFTPEQAAQLLDALLSDNITLQEYLNQVHEAPGAIPREDW